MKGLRAGVRGGVRAGVRGWVPAAMLRARSRDSGLPWYISCVGSSWKDVSTVCIQVVRMSAQTAFKFIGCDNSKDVA